MQTQSVTVHLPEPLYEQIRKQAEDAHRSVEELLVHIAADAASSQPRLAPDLEAELVARAKLPHDELWRAARVTLPARTPHGSRRSIASASAARSLQRTKRHKRDCSTRPTA